MSGNGTGKTSQPIWVDSLWVTRKESVTLSDGDNEITREISVGMNVKSDNRASSSEMHAALNQALSSLIAKEKELWLEAELMRRESADTQGTVSELDAFINGSYSLVDEPNSENSVSQTSNADTELDAIPF